MKNKTQLFPLFLILLASSTIFGQQKATVVVAANLKTAMDSILKVYKLKNPNDVIQVNYGASGKFYEQISNGAPFDLFFSADVAYPEKLEALGKTAQRAQKYGQGRI